MSFIRRSGRHTAVLAGLVLAAAAAFPVIGAQAAARGPAASQAPDNVSVLQSVYCTASTNCWAVGFQREDMHATLNRVLHWNGHHWSRVTTPNPAGSASDDESKLAAVRCLTARN